MDNKEMYSGVRPNHAFWKGCKIYRLLDEFNKKMPRIGLSIYSHMLPAGNVIYIPTVDGPLYMMHDVNRKCYKLAFVPAQKLDHAYMVLFINNNGSTPVVQLEHIDINDRLHIFPKESTIYKNRCGLDGVMLLIFDILQYFKNSNAQVKIGYIDNNEIKISYSEMKKIVLVDRALNEYIPISLISLYSKYMECDLYSDEYKGLASYVTEIRAVKWEKFKNTGAVSNKPHGESYSASTTLSSALKLSEQTQYRANQTSFVEAFYNYPDEHARDLINTLKNKYNRIKRYITFESLYRYFGNVEEYGERKLRDPFWGWCEISQLMPVEIKKDSVSVLYYWGPEDFHYEISMPNISHKLYLSSINTDKYTLYMSSFNRSQGCMSLSIRKNTQEIHIDYINGGDCYDNYKGDKGLKGIMHLCFDILDYFRVRGTVYFMSLTDAAEVKIKNSDVYKTLKLERALNPSIPADNISIYGKYMHIKKDDNYRDLCLHLEKIRALKWVPFSKITYYADGHESEMGNISDTYPDDTSLFDALIMSEKTKPDNTGKMRFVEYFYTHAREARTALIGNIMHKIILSMGYITYESLRRHFED